MKITSFGAAQQVTGSMHLLELADGYRILIDCGLNYEKDKHSSTASNRNFPFSPDEIDQVILTHAHIDHSGNLPGLVRQGYKGQILCTAPTYDFCRYLLMDSVMVQLKELNKRKFARNNKKKPKVTKASELLYGNKDVENTLEKMVAFEFGVEIELREDVRIKFIEAGHILGAASVLVTVIENGKEYKVGFTGDLGRDGSNLVVNTKNLGEVDFLLTESTYGGKFHYVTKNPEDELMDYIEATCIKERGRLIIPAFSVGRTQAIVYSLHKLRRSGRLPEIRVFVDSPLAIESTEIYSRYLSYLNDDARAFNEKYQGIFNFDQLYEVESMKESEAIYNYSEPCIIVSAAGMVEGGRIVEHIYNNIQNPYACILIAGYCAEGTFGWTLKQQNAYISLRGKQVPVYAKVASTDVFSSHPDHNELVRYVKNYKPNRLKKVFLVHGEEFSLNAFATALRSEGYDEVIVAEKGISYQLT